MSQTESPDWHTESSQASTWLDRQISRQGDLVTCPTPPPTGLELALPAGEIESARARVERGRRCGGQGN